MNEPICDGGIAQAVKKHEYHRTADRKCFTVFVGICFSQTHISTGGHDIGQVHVRRRQDRAYYLSPAYEAITIQAIRVRDPNERSTLRKNQRVNQNTTSINL